MILCCVSTEKNTPRSGGKDKTELARKTRGSFTVLLCKHLNLISLSALVDGRPFLFQPSFLFLQVVLIQWKP